MGQSEGVAPGRMPLPTGVWPGIVCLLQGTSSGAELGCRTRPYEAPNRRIICLPQGISSGAELGCRVRPYDAP